MNHDETCGTAIEPERYELSREPHYRFEYGELARRDFFKIAGSGVLIVLTASSTLAQQEAGQESGGRRGGNAAIPDAISAWLHVGEDGIVTVFTGKVEVGQDIRTSLAQVVAEELRTPLASVRLIMGDTDLTPFDAGTFGSLTTRIMSPQLRKAAAAARELLITLAAEELKTESKALVIAEGSVTDPQTRRSLRFGQLTKGQKLVQRIGQGGPLTPPDQWKVAGKPVLKVNGRDIVTGKHKYVSDMKRTGMMYGKVLRPIAFGASLKSVDTRAAEAMPGVTVIRDGEFVGVVAPSQRTASQAIAAIRAEWATTPQISSTELFDHLKKSPPERQNPARRPDFSRGSVAEGLAASNFKLKQTYKVAYIAHVPLEPRAALAEWANDRLTVWTGTQRPFGVRGELAAAFRIPETQIRVIMPDTGSGYGGKHTGEAAVEAARLAKAAGKPVKLVWTREEEFTWAYVRPAGVIEITSGVTSDGLITAWEFHNYNSGSAGIRSLYECPHQLVEFHPSRSPLEQGSYRALASTANHFAREVHIDELAETARLDPLAFRLKNIKDERLRDVLLAAAGKFGWEKARRDRTDKSRGFGIAGGFEKGGYVANCVEVFLDSSTKKIRIVRVVTAFECGAVINPDGLKNQVEGAIIQGIGGAMFEKIVFENGKILNGRLSQYRVPRFSDLPLLETVLLDRRDLPSAGAGEAPIVTIAPAISNAIFDATGIRSRSLPMAPGV
jgi:isoquinoline 1-oxidoreductase